MQVRGRAMAADSSGYPGESSGGTSRVRAGTPPAQWNDVPDSYSASSWVSDAVNGVLCCDVIDQSKHITNKSTWKDQADSVVVKLSTSCVYFGKLQTVPFKDILEVIIYWLLI